MINKFPQRKNIIFNKKNNNKRIFKNIIKEKIYSHIQYF